MLNKSDKIQHKREKILDTLSFYWIFSLVVSLGWSAYGAYGCIVALLETPAAHIGMIVGLSITFLGLIGTLLFYGILMISLALEAYQYKKEKLSSTVRFE